MSRIGTTGLELSVRALAPSPAGDHGPRIPTLQTSDPVRSRLDLVPGA